MPAVTGLPGVDLRRPSGPTAGTSARGGALEPGADPSDPVFAVYGRNAWKSRLRAHPDVAAAHGDSSGG